MKVALISGQNHKGSTYHIGRKLAESLVGEREENIKEIILPKDLPHFCRGCTQCFMEDEKKCPDYPYMKKITDVLDQAEVLIFASPVYVYHVTAPMKNMLDHLGYRWMVHRPEESMFRKQAVCISTAAGGGMRSTIKDMKDSCYYWGVGKTYSFGIAVRSASWKHISAKKREKIEKNIRILSTKIKKNCGRVRPGLKTKAFFNVMRFLQRGEGWNLADKKYWEEKGWTGKKRPWNK